MITYDEALSAACLGNVVFILGAGFSTGATNFSGKNLPSGTELKQIITESVGFPNDYSLDVVSQQYIDTFGSKALLEMLKQEFLVASYEKFYNLFAKLNKAHIYTTNYDNLVEKIFTSNKKNLKSYELKDDCKKSAKGLFVLHINGKIDEAVTDLSMIRLTLGSYDEDFSTSPWIKYFVDDLSSADAIFVIGHSLLCDLDLRRRLATHKNKCFIIQPPEISDSTRKILTDYGRVCENGVVQFLEDLSVTEIPETKDDFSKLKLKCFHKIEQGKILDKPTDDDMFNLFLKGDNSHRVFYQDLDKKFVGLINRHQLYQAAELLNSNYNLVIYSDLGNGKTVFLHQLFRILSDKHFLIFNQNNVSDYQKEIRKISSLNEEVILIFDPYNSCYEVVEYLKNFAEKNIKFILLARSAMHENYEKRLEDDLSGYKIRNIDLNTLNTDECIELNKILEVYGLWGDDQGLPYERKIDILTKRCKGSLQDIILYLFETSELKDRFTSLIVSEKNKNYRKLLSLSFINSVLELNLKIEDFSILYHSFDVYKTYRSSLFKEFVCYDRYGWRMKSPIISKSMLNSISFSKKEIIDALVDLTLKLDELHDGCAVYTNALKNLGSCSYLSFIFDYDFDKKALLDYFENVKNANFNQNNYFFWLQYAIACVNTKTYERAKKYFQNSYSLAVRRGKTFSTFQIDNHYARYLLEKQIDSRNPINSYEVFEEAHRLLMKSKTDRKSENKYYQFRVARSYREYYNIFYKKFNEKEKAKFIMSCEEIQKDLQQYESEVRRVREFLRNDVFECKNNLLYILTDYNK